MKKKEMGEEEEEEVLLALIEHRAKEVKHLRTRVAYYNSQLNVAEKALEETHHQLTRLRTRACVLPQNATIRVKEEETSSASPFYNNVDSENSDQDDCRFVKTKRKPLLVIPSLKPRLPQNATATTIRVKEEEPSSTPFKYPTFYNNVDRENSDQDDCKPLLVIPSLKPRLPQNATIRVKEEETSLKYPTFYNNVDSENSDQDDCKPLLLIPSVKPLPKQNQQPKGKKRKFVTQEEDVKKDLIKMVCSCSSPDQIKYETSTQIFSQHKRKLRSLVLCPTDDQLFATSALDGIVNLWQIQGKWSHANLVGSINGSSLKQRRWPEDVAWHPHGGSLISVYTADDGDSQLAILNLQNNGEKKNEVVFLEDKPHDKGIINNIMFMPWGGDNSFVTCGSDHAVVYWTEKYKLWKPKVLHKSMHSSAVMGVAGMQEKQMVVSVGADKRIIGFDLQSQKAEYKHQIESKCMSVVPNPHDFNLFMVQTGTPQRQLRLFDMRLKGWTSQIHEFGWNQESSTCQSALINQCWSPDGLYLTSGSADPMIHIFDIRFNANQPSQSIKAHQKRVFKAAWHRSYPLLISISSDLNIGLHNVII